MLATPEWLSNRMILDNVWEGSCNNFAAHRQPPLSHKLCRSIPGLGVYLLASDAQGHLLNSPGLLFRISP